MLHFTLLIHLHISHTFWYNRHFRIFWNPQMKIFSSEISKFFKHFFKNQNLVEFSTFQNIIRNWGQTSLFTNLLWMFSHFLGNLTCDIFWIWYILWFSRVICRVFRCLFWNISISRFSRHHRHFKNLLDFFISTDNLSFMHLLFFSKWFCIFVNCDWKSIFVFEFLKFVFLLKICQFSVFCVFFIFNQNFQNFEISLGFWILLKIFNFCCFFLWLFTFCSVNNVVLSPG